MFLPEIAYAVTFNSVYNKTVTLVINPLIQILFTVALIIFLWGVMEYMRGKDGSEARKKGQAHIIWGIVGLAIMLGVWGIIYTVSNSFSFTSPPNSGVDLNQFIQHQKETTN